MSFNFSYYSCVAIDGDDRVKNDLEIICYLGQHTYWALGVALPALVVWGLGIPLFSYILLSKVKDKLESLEVK